MKNLQTATLRDMLQIELLQIFLEYWRGNMLTVLASQPLTNVLKMLAHDVRWKLLSALAYSDYRVNELSALLQRPLNVVSYHLRLLHSESIVIEHRSRADGRDIYYSLDLEKLENMYQMAAESLHPALGRSEPAIRSVDTDVNRPPTRVLFLCTHNSARSQIAEALLRHLGKARVAVFSAGSEVTHVRPEVLEVLQKHDVDPAGLHSKHLSQFVGQKFDYVITVCDKANESCPVFPGDPERIHWRLPDPSAVTEPDKRYLAFVDTYLALEKRLKLFLIVIERGQK